MKFGAYFAYWEKQWDADYVFYCKKLSKLGFDILEIAAGGLEARSEKELSELGKAAADQGITLTCCIGLPPKYDVSSSEDSVRKPGIAYLKKLLCLMDKIDSRVLGGIIYACWPCDYSKYIDKKQSWDRSVMSMQEVCRAADELGITLMMETVNRYEQFIINDSKEAVAFVEQIGCRNAKIMLDSFHMNIEEDDLESAIVLAGKHLGHFHIGECNRKVPGRGHMPWDAIARGLKQIGYTGGVVMEPFVKTGGEVGANIKVFRDLSNGAGIDEMDKDIQSALLFIKSKFLDG